mmetsp:Transcript_4260/g.9457  ORF Transcript_4260/g.9457 Transcript_4260/m.9457 type:complete len:271 (+) Transcript_4260:954-1766(+)|eukprot:CAMPEP_0168791784 /NCGR_PEP_ID=MMETSP0725-20121227/14170_1 /TAXON_ID=265536 /ORGANISM="Amphiprora sp., Strain CCMP467" /LENGTH=270 /DNA_ID=CAMNT_0008842383 /DNA_START=256 /DNA_END=1068 /DNA_ORIENTATION=+
MTTLKPLEPLVEETEHKENDKQASLSTKTFTTVSPINKKNRHRPSKARANGYFTIVAPPKLPKYGYQDTTRYKPSQSYQRARLYPIQEVDERNPALQGFGSENPYRKNLKTLPRPTLARTKNRMVQDHNTPAFQDFPKKAMPVVAMREGYPMKLQGVHHQHQQHHQHPAMENFNSNNHSHYHRYTPAYPQYVDPAQTMPRQQQQRNHHHQQQQSSVSGQVHRPFVVAVGPDRSRSIASQHTPRGGNSPSNHQGDAFGIHLVKLAPWLSNC